MLFNKLSTERVKALGNDKVKYNLYGVIISEIQRKNTTNNVPDSEVLQTVKKILQSVQETLTVQSTEQLLQEKSLLEELLPKQLTEEELFKIMKDLVLKDSSFKEKKNLFPYLKANYNGQYDGKVANQLFSKLD